MAGQLRAIVYSRVSTDAQERDGTSLDTQEQASQEFVSESANEEDGRHQRHAGKVEYHDDNAAAQKRVAAGKEVHRKGAQGVASQKGHKETK